MPSEESTSETQPEDSVEDVLEELDRLDSTHNPTVAIFDGHEARPVVAQVGEDLRLLSSWLVYARETNVEEFRHAWDEHGAPRTVALSTQSHRFDASDFQEVADLD